MVVELTRPLHPLHSREATTLAGSTTELGTFIERFGVLAHNSEGETFRAGKANRAAWLFALQERGWRPTRCPRYAVTPALIRAADMSNT